MTTPAQEGIAAAKRDDEARAKKVFVLQYHSFDKSDRDDGDQIAGVFENELDAVSALAQDLEDCFGGIKFSDLIECPMYLGDGTWQRTEWVMPDSDGFKYIITPVHVK